MLTPPDDPSHLQPDPLSHLLATRPMTAARWGLERIEALLGALGHPEGAFESIHIAGTNGKGSTAAFAAGVLHARGVRTGLYTSPHLVDVRERVVVDGMPPREEELQELAARIDALPEAREATYFEVTTALAFAAFATAGVEWAVVEAGLGGRLDATNALRPRSTCVTTIGRDHVDLLGDTLEEIALEKAGIFKPGVPAVIGEPDPAVAGVLAGRARAVGAPLVRLGADAFVTGVTVTLSGTSFTLVSDAYPGGIELRAALVGAHQARNAALAALSIDAAGLAPDAAALREGIAHTRLAGRFEVRGARRPVRILDIAHNREAVAAFLDTARAVGPARPWVAVVSVLRDKPWPEMVDMLRDTMDAIILTQAESAPASRRWDPRELERRYEGAAGVEVVLDLDAALARADELCGDGTVFITGSAHTVGDVRGRMEDHEEA